MPLHRSHQTLDQPACNTGGIRGLSITPLERHRGRPPGVDLDCSRDYCEFAVRHDGSNPQIGDGAAYSWYTVIARTNQDLRYQRDVQFPERRLQLVVIDQWDELLEIALDITSMQDYRSAPVGQWKFGIWQIVRLRAPGRNVQFIFPRLLVHYQSA